MAKALGRRSRAGLQTLGWIGLILSILLAFGILLGRIWVGGTIGQVFTSADVAIGIGVAGLDQASSRLNDGLATLDSTVSELASAPAGSAVPAGIAARLTDIGDRYAAIRDRYVDARAKAASAISLAQAASGLLPGVTVDGDSTPVLDAIDDKLTGLDDALRSLRTAAATRASDAVVAAQTLRGTVAGVADAATAVKARVVRVQTTLDDAQSTIERVLWIGAGGLLIIVAYLALLNGLIIWLARRARPDPVLAPATPVEPDPETPAA
jgi:hypothetical protein